MEKHGRKNLMPLIPKKKQSKLIPRIRHKTITQPIKKIDRQRDTIHQLYMGRLINTYLDMFGNIINGRINRAITRFRCLQQCNRAEMHEELYCKFKVKFAKAILERTIQLWRVTDRSMNVYIQRMIDRLIFDEVRSKSREYATRLDLHAITADPNIIIDDIANHSVSNEWLSLNRFSNAETDLLTKELYARLIQELEKYEPDKIPILMKIIDPNIDTNFSSPSVHSLKTTIKAILRDLR